MEKNFQNLKRKFLHIAIIKSVLTGLAAGAFTVGVLLLSLKLAGIAINAGFYVLIGIGVAALTGGLLFLFIRPTDNSVAKKLDNEYNLNEKIQTMVAFRGIDGAMLAMQREDAENTLSGIVLKRPPLKRIAVCVAAGVVALAMFISALCIPGTPVRSDDGYELTKLQQVALQQLIDDVNKSSLDEQLKTPTAEVLENLLDGLNGTQQGSVMRNAVLTSITIIDGVLADSNSYISICSALGKSDNENVKALSADIKSNAVYYRKLNVKLDSLAKVNEIASSSDDVLGEAILQSLSQLRSSYNEVSGKELSDALNNFAQKLNDALGTQTVESDGLYGCLKTFCTELVKVALNVSSGGYSADNINQQLDSAFNKFAADGGAALADQTYNCMMDEFVRDRLADIFQISAPALPNRVDETPSDTPGDGSGDKDPDGSHEGGGGNKDVIYGSNDLVYSPEDDALVKYGTVINSYYAAVLERISAGEMGEELGDYINKYFEILFSGIEDEDAEN